jgi:hypothetical protein
MQKSEWYPVCPKRNTRTAYQRFLGSHPEPVMFESTAWATSPPKPSGAWASVTSRLYRFIVNAR